MNSCVKLLMLFFLVSCKTINIVSFDDLNTRYSNHYTCFKGRIKVGNIFKNESFNYIAISNDTTFKITLFKMIKVAEINAYRNKIEVVRNTGLSLEKEYWDYKKLSELVDSKIEYDDLKNIFSIQQNAFKYNSKYRFKNASNSYQIDEYSSIKKKYKKNKLKKILIQNKISKVSITINEIK